MLNAAKLDADGCPAFRCCPFFTFGQRKIGFSGCFSRIGKLVYGQQKEMYDNHTHKCENRIVSLEQPHVRPIHRGKRHVRGILDVRRGYSGVHDELPAIFLLFFCPFFGSSILAFFARWVKLASIMPWEHIEQIYMAAFQSENGRPALSSRIAFGAIFIKENGIFWLLFENRAVYGPCAAHLAKECSLHFPDVHGICSAGQCPPGFTGG